MHPPENRPPIETPFEVRLLATVGFSLWLVATIACVWEVLALQAPDSPLHAGVLAGPIAQLRGFAFALGTANLVAALVWPRLYADGRGRSVALLLALGALLHVFALTYAALRGLVAVQLLDPRADARYALYGRAVAHALTMWAVALLLARTGWGKRRAALARERHRIAAEPACPVGEPTSHGE